MKTLSTLIVLMLVLSVKTEAQVITQDVNFDFYQSATNNDFENNFYGLTNLTQIQTNGITGGCLSLIDSIDWGNDRGIYCVKYKPNSGDTTLTSISFKYDSTTVHTSSYQRAMTIWMHPWADPNHYVIATVSGDKKLELITYGWVNTPYPLLNLLHNHWYKYNLKTAFFAPGFQVYIKAEVFDLGVTGTSTPSLVNSDSHTIVDNILALDTAITVAISGAKYGGGLYLDNFHFHGRKGVSNCIVTGITEIQEEQNLSVYPTPAANTLYIQRNNESKSKLNVVIFSIEGKKVLQFETFQLQTELNISSLANGVYIVQCNSLDESKKIRIIVSK